MTTFESPLVALGMPVPDSAIARQARELIGDVEAPYLVNHSVRAYAWAVELALHDGLTFDPEILYVSAALHDIGLVPAYDLGGCFETDGAIAAERFALEHGQTPARAKAICSVADGDGRGRPPRGVDRHRRHRLPDRGRPARFDPGGPRGLPAPHVQARLRGRVRGPGVEKAGLPSRGDGQDRQARGDRERALRQLTSARARPSAAAPRPGGTPARGRG
jgi:hypothetical protein